MSMVVPVPTVRAVNMRRRRRVLMCLFAGVVMAGMFAMRFVMMRFVVVQVAGVGGCAVGPALGFESFFN